MKVSDSPPTLALSHKFRTKLVEASLLNDARLLKNVLLQKKVIHWPVSVQASIHLQSSLSQKNLT